MRDTYREFEKRGIAMLVVSSTDLEMTSYVAEVLRAPYPVLSDPEWSVFYAYGVGSGFGLPLPGTFIIDPAGMLRWRWAAPFSPFFQPPTPQQLLAVFDELAKTEG